MRHKNETATSFNQLREITQAIQAQRNSEQTSYNANNTSEITSQSAPKKPKGAARTKKSALKPTKRAFSERHTIRDNSQASAKEIKRGR
ncbi:hypothetical protein EC506_07130 [Helicobacter pylori]|uniref:hypothetical protein n=1 Tax=Helicobacter pylori TaxID=210 RepID=UPI000FDD2329|nr:hypothetical protein [Helicobacter pylori]RVY94062.1 hypothetical protein EC506_07130 [Helicobacter pylori]